MQLITHTEKRITRLKHSTKKKKFVWKFPVTPLKEVRGISVLQDTTSTVSTFGVGSRLVRILYSEDLGFTRNKSTEGRLLTVLHTPVGTTPHPPPPTPPHLLHFPSLVRVPGARREGGRYPEPRLHTGIFIQLSNKEWSIIGRRIRGFRTDTTVL